MSSSFGRWEHLLESKPIPILEHLKAEVAKQLSAELGRWPLEVAELDPTFVQKHAELFQPEARRPDPAVFDEGLRLAKWDLLRELEAVDDYFRNQRFLERGLTPTDKSALLFLQRWLVEQMLGLMEATQGRVKRMDCVDILERTGRRLFLP